MMGGKTNRKYRRVWSRWRRRRRRRGRSRRRRKNEKRNYEKRTKK
jgi:hypothetical protein